ncbi:MAG: hypothetical protein AVDCRST_MAG77-2032, partial [uncultured Chloroflexi bacterium]
EPEPVPGQRERLPAALRRLHRGRQNPRRRAAAGLHRPEDGQGRLGRRRAPRPAAPRGV